MQKVVGSSPIIRSQNPVNRGFLFGNETTWVPDVSQQLVSKLRLGSPSHHAAYREPCDRQNRGCDAAVEVFLHEKARRLPKTQRLATTTLEVCIPGDRTRPTRRPGSPLNLAQKSFRGWLPRSQGTVGGTNSYFHLMLGPEERLKICCRGDEGSPFRRMATSSSSRQKRRTSFLMTPRPAPTTTGRSTTAPTCLYATESRNDEARQRRHALVRQSPRAVSGDALSARSRCG
jgi:hypothetical protein